MKSSALIDMLFYDLRGLTNYPLMLYPKALRIFLTFVLPWAFINYYPMMFITGKRVSGYETALGLAAPFVGVLWFLLAMGVFRMGLRRYTGAGG